MTINASTRVKPSQRLSDSHRGTRPAIVIAPAHGTHTSSRIIAFTHYQQLLTAFQVLADALTIGASFLAGYWLWSLIGPSVALDAYEPESITRYYSFIGVTFITCLVGLEVHGLYQPQRSLMNVREFELVLKVWGKACAFTLGILFLAHELYFSRGVFILTWACLLLFLMVQRYGFFKFNHYLRTKGFVETTALIYGAGVVGRKLMEKFKQSPKLGLHVAGFIDDNSSLTGKHVLETPVLGDFTHLRDTILPHRRHQALHRPAPGALQGGHRHPERVPGNPLRVPDRPLPVRHRHPAGQGHRAGGHPPHRHDRAQLLLQDPGGQAPLRPVRRDPCSCSSPSARSCWPWPWP